MQIVFKAFLLLWSIELGEALFFPEHIRSYVVVGIQPIVTVDDMVYMVGKRGKEFRLGHLVWQTIHPFVNGIASLVMDMTFIAEHSRLHTVHILIASLLEIRIIPTHLVFTCLEEVTRVKFIRNRQRHDVQFLDTFLQSPFSSHAEHLEDRLLSKVIGILGPTLALGYPHIVLFHINDIVDIVTEMLAAHQLFP